eukprot:gene4885-5239_t
MSRSNALASNDAHKFIDPISLDIMRDPVLASDGHSYDRRTITDWFAAQKAQGRPITSPLTNLPLIDDTLTPNIALKRELDIFIASTSTIQPVDIKFTLSSDIFKELDRLSSRSKMRLLDFEPPKIVVLGNESHGKSTILERMIGLPLFPKEKGICTRCVVRVHMRRSAADQPSLAEVSVQKLQKGNQSPAILYTRVIALDNIRKKIKELMDELVRRDPQRRMILDDHEIIVKINLPYCLNVDILDLPGLVTTSPASTTQNLPQVTKEIAMRVIREQRESSFFLLVNDVRVPANQSRGCEVVQEAKIEGQTLGIFTKVDTFVSDDGSEALELQQLLDSSRGGFPLGYGWMAAASRSVDVGGTMNKLQAFQTMEQNESRCFREKYGTLVAMNKMGIQQIRQRIQTLYEFFIHDRWIPHIRTKLNDFISQVGRQLLELGTPLPPDDDYNDFMVYISQKMNVNLSMLNEDWIRRFSRKVLHRLFVSCEKEVIKLKEDEMLWDLMNHYHIFIGEEVEGMTYNEYPSAIHPFQSSSMMVSGSDFQFPRGTYQFDKQAFARDVLAIDATAASIALESKIRESLNQLYKRLHDRINPDERIHKSIYNAIIKMSLREDSTFKLQRFEVLHYALVQVVANQFHKLVKSFDDWFGEFISSINEKPLLHCVYYRKDEIRCKLYWSHPNEIRRYPHMILDKFYRCIGEYFSTNLVILLSASMNITLVEEGCKTDRLKFFERIKRANEVKEEVEKLAQKVQSEMKAMARR